VKVLNILYSVSLITSIFFIWEKGLVEGVGVPHM